MALQSVLVGGNQVRHVGTGSVPWCMLGCRHYCIGVKFWASCRWCHSISDRYEPESVGSSVSREDWLVFQLYVNGLVPWQLHCLGGEESGTVGITGLSNE